MAGLRGQDRAPRAPVRERRNADNLATNPEFTAPGEVIQVDGDVVFVLVLADAGGLANDDGELIVLLATNPGIEFDEGLRVKVKANGGVTRDADGLSIAEATDAVRGGVLRQVLQADVPVLADNSGGTSGAGTIAAVGVTITAPGDAPADADALRDDLVTNTIPSIETELSALRNAIATLAAYATVLEDKINAMLAAQITAGQMNAA
jgi:hypothetical protein